MRILTVANVPADPDSGAAGTVYHTNVALRQLGHDVDELWDAQLGPRRIRHGNLHSLIEQPLAYRRAVLRATEQKPYDAVMISQPQGYLAAKALRHCGFSGVVINRSHGLELRVNSVLPVWHRQLGVPASRHPMLTRALRPFLKRQWTESIRWFDGVVLPSHDDRDFLEQHLLGFPQVLTTIHHGVPDLFLDHPRPDMTDDRRQRLLFVGQHSFIKGPDLLVEIVNRVLTESPGLSMTWVTSEEAHRWILDRLSDTVSDRVKLHGWVDQSRLLPLFDRHGIFVFPSFFEGAGKACIEALARGLNVVASDTGGMRDHLSRVQPDGCCPIGDVDAFCRQILKYSRSSTPLNNHAIQYCRSLTWRNCARQLVQFFRQCEHEKTTALQMQ
ncbi:glycosyltransferase family 4 protein [Roseiconus lacunae]|uniref:glycosyltransferase family 4 protein n=1 Tax=Roseiconus lacunae TaxID=2605694 RepID=UPI0011F3E012|nr:glycosyltransferase family 4 protein [Roseiconus lacunae]